MLRLSEALKYLKGRSCIISLADYAVENLRNYGTASGDHRRARSISVA
jgi:hypothetical protein